MGEPLIYRNLFVLMIIDCIDYIMCVDDIFLVVPTGAAMQNLIDGLPLLWYCKLYLILIEIHQGTLLFGVYFLYLE